MDEETNNLIARLYLAGSNFGTVEPREFADWAVTKLEEGFDSKNLRILASQFNAQSLSDVEDHFNKSLAELNWDYPNEEISVERYSESIMKKIVSSEMSPSDACFELYMLCSAMGYPRKLYNWNGIYWAVEDMDEDSWNELVRDEAQRCLNGEETESINEGFMLRPTAEQSLSFWERIKRLIK